MKWLGNMKFNGTSILAFEDTDVSLLKLTYGSKELFSVWYAESSYEHRVCRRAAVQKNFTFHLHRCFSDYKSKSILALINYLSFQFQHFWGTYIKEAVVARIPFILESYLNIFRSKKTKETYLPEQGCSAHLIAKNKCGNSLQEKCLDLWSAVMKIQRLLNILYAQ